MRSSARTKSGGSRLSASAAGKFRTIFPARASAVQLLWVLLFSSVLIAGVAIWLRVGLLRLCFGKIEDDVMGYALIYFVISAISYPAIAIYNGLAALFRTMGNSRITMIASVLVNLLNIIGNALFIYVFKFGVAGAAWSSTLSRLFGMVMLLLIIRKKSGQIYIRFSEFRLPELGTIKRILRIGIPGSLENSVFQLGRILVISMIAGFGTVQVAANAVANNLDAFGCIPGQALGLATITVVGQSIGAGNFVEARKYEQKLMKVAFASMAILNIIIIATLPLSLKLYSVSDEALKLASILIILHDGFAILLWPPSFVLPNALRAAQDVKFTMVVSIFSMIFFRIFFTWIIGVRLGFGIVGVWIAMIFDWIFRGSCFTYRIRSGKWLSKL